MFQPTRPAWGATLAICSLSRELGGFNPRARVGRDDAFENPNFVWDVSIHAPRVCCAARRSQTETNARSTQACLCNVGGDVLLRDLPAIQGA
jgi:hypothetical protein